MVKIRYTSGIYILEANQIIKGSLNDVWVFFSKPENLQKLTPKKLSFRITSGGQENIYRGKVITYKIGLFIFFKTNWVTEITNVVKGSFFIDEQRFGPYRMWHHQHHFYEVNHGIKIYDKVYYKVPYGWLGRIANAIFIKNKLINIFNYRAEVIQRQFN